MVGQGTTTKIQEWERKALLVLFPNQSYSNTLKNNLHLLEMKLAFTRLMPVPLNFPYKTSQKLNICA